MNLHELRVEPRGLPVDRQLDQAAGLRRLFAANVSRRFVPLLSNPHVAFGGVVIERLVAAFGERGLHTLVVDASERAAPPPEIAEIDLADAIEPLSRQASHLCARGLPQRHLDARGSSAGLLQALADSAPHADVVLVHAPAADLWRLFQQREARPVVLAADHPAAVTHAYAGIKLLALRGRLMTHDLLLAARSASPRSSRIAAQLADCAERFLGGAQCAWAAIDPAADADEPPSPALRRLAQAALQASAGRDLHANVLN